MNRTVIILLVSLAALPSFTIGDETQKAKKRVYRSISSDAMEIAVNSFSGTGRQPNEIEQLSEHGPEAVQTLEGSSNRVMNARSAWESGSATAIGIGETYYRQGLWESAGEWYLKALDLNPASVQAAEGLVMSAFQAGQFNHAYRIGEEFSSSLPGVKDIVIKAANIEIDLLLARLQYDKAGEMLANFPEEEAGFDDARKKLNSFNQRLSLIGTGSKEGEFSPNQMFLLDAAVTAYRSDQFSSALLNIEGIGRETELSSDIQFIKAWSLYHTGRYDEAYRIFDQLYKKQTDTASARGIVISLRKMADHELLQRVVEQKGGILALEAENTEGWLTETPSSFMK